MAIQILRVGHRIARDKRLSTHCCLVARALGATKLWYSGEHDQSLEDSVAKVVSDFGGSFSVEHVTDWPSLITRFKRKGAVVHLTVYGLPYQKHLVPLRKHANLLVIIGGEKVPPQTYQLVDKNLAVTSQPHSEVAALALFLHDLGKGAELTKSFRHAKKKIIPQERGKAVQSR